MNRVVNTLAALALIVGLVSMRAPLGYLGNWPAPFVSANKHTSSAQSAPCQTICFRSAQYWLLNLNRLPGGTVLIGGVNFNKPVSTSDITTIKSALLGGSSPLHQFNREFTAAQLNLNFAGGSGSALAINALWSRLSCFGIFFVPFTLSNGFPFTPDSVLSDIFEQARLAIQDDRTADMPALTSLFDQLNGNDPLNRCSQSVAGTNQPTVFNGPPIFNTSPENPTKPACGCSGEPTYNQGISLVAREVSKCERVGMFPGINQDTGGTVFLHNGEFFLYVKVLEIPGRGFNWAFAMKYRSGVIFDGPLGHNWEHNNNRRLFVEASGNVLRMDGAGRADRYLLTGSAYQAPLGFYTQLRRQVDGGFIERDKHGTKVFYSAPDTLGIARMTEVRDSEGNRMRFVYNTEGQLIRVIETLGRAIDYRYNAEGRLVEVMDFMSRKISFGYDGHGDLVTVTLPAVFGTPNGNDFLAGKTMRFSYIAGLSDPRLNHNLLDITAPNETAANGPPRVKVEYETDASRNVDRVMRQTIGGVNASGVPAGGTITYEYHDLVSKRTADMPPPDSNTPVTQTTVTDRNGNITEYQFNNLGNIVRMKEFATRGIRPDDAPFFETRYEYNRDGEMTRVIKPEGNVIEYGYDNQNPDRFQQGNLLSETRLPDADRGGDQSFIKLSYAYEPIYNHMRSMTEARGNDPSYQPQNGGSNSPDRYTTVYIFDYQESANFAALADELGISVDEVIQRLNQASVPMGLGDVNGDGRVDQITGNVLKVIHPSVRLLPGSNMSVIEGGTTQPIEETFAYNDFGQVTSTRDAEGNVTLRAYHPENDPGGDGANPTPGVGSGPFGYLKEEIRDAFGSPERNSKTNPPPAVIHRRYFYDPVGNLIREIDGRGIATRYIVNQLNQVVQTIRAADVSQARANPEEPNWNGCGDQTLVECNRGMVAFGYLTNVFYDHNNNVVRREVENRDSNNQALAGNFVTRGFVYDILDNLVEEQQEASENPPQILVKRLRYDRNGNHVLEISPLAAAGSRPSNVVSFVVDERDLPFTSTRGGLTGQFKSLAANADIPERSRIPNSPDISTLSKIYDLNRNLVGLIDGADNNGDGRPETTTNQYDGFDRQVREIDAVGNLAIANFDPAGNGTRVRHFGPVKGSDPGNQSLLSETESKYDELNRLFERDDHLFIYAGVSYVRPPLLKDGPLGGSNDGLVTTRYEYDRKGRQTFLVEDDLSTGRTFYDGADRAIRAIDPGGNESLTIYDDNGNTTRFVETSVTLPEEVQAGKVPDLRETFTFIFVYDALNRPIRVTNNLGHTNRGNRDSRNNLVLASDAQHSKAVADLITDPLGLFPAPGQDPRGMTKINRPGNTMERFYDGIDRRLAEVRHLRVDGQGKNPIDTSNPSNPDGLIVNDSAWDANSNLIALAEDGNSPGDQNTSIGLVEPNDPQGNVTRYLYDDLNRRRQEIFDNGTVKAFTYDADSNIVGRVDANGSITRYTYDGINRLLRKDITRANQVIGTTRQEFDYDGLSRPTRSFDNNEPGDTQDDVTVTFAYDSLSRLLEEVHNGHAVSSRWAGDSNRIGLVYPNGRELEVSFDKLDRVSAIKDKGAPKSIAVYSYIGKRRLLERTYENGIRLTFLDDTRQRLLGYDGLRRPVQSRHLRSDNSLVVGFTYTYDRMNNKLTEEKLHDPANGELYPYDSVYRLVDFQRGSLNATKDAIVTPSPNFLQRQRWRLDGTGNWARTERTANGTGEAETREHSPLNEITKIGGATTGGITIVSDKNGNEIDDGTFTFQWDHQNRLRAVNRKSDGALVARYTYDAAGRRTGKLSTLGGISTTLHFCPDGWQEIEEWGGDNALLKQYVYGIYVDEPLVLDRNLDGGDNVFGPGDQRLFYHQNTLYSVFAVTDTAGRILEGYQYDVYGRQTLYTPGPNDVVDFGGDDMVFSYGISIIDNPYFFTGRRLDSETLLYYYRTRYFDWGQGRFIHRDPSGLWDFGNPYAYVGNQAPNMVDPAGLFGWGDIIEGVKEGASWLGDKGTDAASWSWDKLTEAFSFELQIDEAILGFESDYFWRPVFGRFSRYAGWGLGHIPYIGPYLREGWEKVWDFVTCLPPFDMLNSRPLNGQERSWAQGVFGNSLDRARVRIAESCFFGLGTGARTPLTTIFFFPGQYTPDTETTDQGFLIHELTHVWQTQHGIPYKIVTALGTTISLAGYNYGGPAGLRAATAAGRNFLSFNTEQQGDILRDYHNCFMSGASCNTDRGGHTITPGPPGTIDRDTYETFVNFVRNR